MPNLRLEHSGNMNITSAEITSAGTLNVSYGPNNTGSVTGFTFTLPDTEFVCGGTYTITGTPIYIGTALTENFVVSGTDTAGVNRSDTCALNQKYDTNLFTLRYKSETAASTYLAEITREDWHSNYVELDVAINGTDSFYITIGWRNNNDTATEYFSTCLINVTPPEPVPATSLTINVPSEIIISGLATATYTPTVATVNLVYSSSDTSKATIDPHSGVITVLEDGVVTFCVEDTISSLSDCKSAIVYATHPGPDTSVTITSLTLITPDTVEGTGYASAVYEPAYAAVDLHYTSEAPGIASINETTGQITVYENGVVTICVTDMISGLMDCKQVPVLKPATFIVYYNVTSTTQPTWIKGMGHSCWEPDCPEGSRENARITSARLDDYTEVPLTEYGDVYFTFPQTGIQRIIYTSSDMRIPSWAFFPSDANVENNIVALDATSVKEIGWEAFINNHSLTSITMPDVVYLGVGAFAYCYGLENIVLPNGLIYMDNTFMGCHNLETVVIPRSVTCIGCSEFDDCGNLNSITFLGSTPPDILCEGSDDGYSLGRHNLTFPIYVPCDSVSAYRTRFPSYSNRIVCDGNYYANSIQLSVSSLIVASGTATSTCSPEGAIFSPMYYSSNPEIISIDTFTGVMTVNGNGTVTISARDAFTYVYDEKQVTGVASPTPYKDKYLTFEIISGGSVTWVSGSHTVSVRKNEGTWETMPSSLSVVPGDILEFKGTNSNLSGSTFGVSGDCKFNASGNIMSIIKESSFSGETSLGTNSTFNGLFSGCTGIVNASALVLPATALTNYCYWGMFYGCTSLTMAPELPATAMKRSDNTNATNCYVDMFRGCSSLFYVNCMLASVRNSGDLSSWLYGVAANGFFVKNSNISSSDFVKLQVPSSWEVISS